MEADMLFCRLADPDVLAIDVPEHRVPELCSRASLHRVEAIVLRKLRAHADHPAVRALSEELVPTTALTMMLEHRAAPIGHEIRARALSAAMVKGGVFARKLYAHPEDRPWTDIDILAAPEARDEIASVLRDLGYRFAGAEGLRNRKREEKWGHPDAPEVLIELHGDMVHYPSLRRGVRFGHAELTADGQQDPEAPLALFATAVVHVTLGHKFHKLRLMVDALQAFRALDAADRGALPECMEQLSLRVEAALVLHLIAGLFDMPDARDIASKLDPTRQGRLAALIVRPRDVLEAKGPGLNASHLRRLAFRGMQQLHLSRSAV